MSSVQNTLRAGPEISDTIKLVCGLGRMSVTSLASLTKAGKLTVVISATPPIAHLSELYHNRRIPLLLGQVALIASQAMLMEARKYWVMILARVAQGLSGSVIWVVGLALV